MNYKNEKGMIIMKRGITSLVLGGMIITGMMGCSNSAKPVQQVSEMEVVEKSQEELKVEYLEVVKEQNGRAEVAMKKIKSLFDKATLHPELFKDEGFKSDLENEYDVIEDVYFILKLYRETDIPTELYYNHLDLVKGYEYCYNGNNLTWDGINELNTQKMKAGAEKLSIGAQYVRDSGLDVNKK
ncbi:hypothetical protein PQE70_gp099 [Bacillus phage vB_BanS_Nate]|uniref:Lipoprotein n=1 Tax=Bacillus phage vB_BanS_Nate TaxID=2894788 RepID=A0AAE8YY28_9CAUD|nr:hypothetical protein PQE70_gp099 [Bacillus phage vB_BanS_Nate]UGO50952.1 hypothetical protein NATE_99 [Bacillus phage vB_BanS_Nate]